MIDKNHYGVEPFNDQQRAAIRRLRVIDGTLAVRLGVDVLVLVHAVLLSGRSVVDASRGLPKAKASYWRTAFRFALDEIAALLGLATDKPSALPCRSGTHCGRRPWSRQLARARPNNGSWRPLVSPISMPNGLGRLAIGVWRPSAALAGLLTKPWDSSLIA